MSTAERANNVCRACMLRKKACDKSLPACGFCAARGQPCRYEHSDSRIRGGRRYNPGRHFVAIGSFSLPGVPHNETKGFLYADVLSQSLDGDLHHVACQLTDLTNQTYDTIVTQYFRTCHVWIPIISPDAFERSISHYRDQRHPPPADFTVLYLSMMLLVLPTVDPLGRLPRENQESLYTGTKSAFLRVQTSICSSLRLVQAALLISLREYALIRPEAAYVSLTTCVGMARLLQIRATSGTNSAPERREMRGSQSDILEGSNIAWGIVIVERLILCEIGRTDLRPQTEFPGPDTRLPSDLRATGDGVDFRPEPDMTQAQHLATRFELAITEISRFGRVAQVAKLLDQLMCILRHLTNDNNKLPQLIQLEDDVRTTLEIVVTDSESRTDSFCVPLSLAVRAYFALHKCILDALEESRNERVCWQRRKSSMALGMTQRMILDVAQWQQEQHTPFVPICCLYNLRETRKYLQEQNKHGQQRSVGRDIEELLDAEGRYHRMWGISFAPGH